ncbi:uncharacterized protein LOC121372557 [Gigantopelta aegis]|uniref:uncharacterized protein LOC121372557 n=1 Tax=Gigantopelta aegis TaxID=1735272 RepID=UPI001B88B407|nr:uncharacterized protein LOC121372557 [Gigantopelta aegis]XP_041354882.1 uncharacterized protein LOC121372557 [Gigantopelta aegis]XP_041354883.1 uncharacterized protein LOC121372557 [Gigantopelta aegis]
MERRHRGGRLRPGRTTSPTTCTAERRIRRKRDPGADEMIRFVREFQLQKQPTLLRIQKRAPLPDIGHLAAPSVQDSGFDEKTVDDNGIDGDAPLDDEVAAIDDSATSVGTNGYKIVCDVDAFQRRPMHNARSFETHLSQQAGRFKYDGVLNSYGRLNIGRINQPTLVQLPPIQRDDLPERPSAPSPSVTPPLPGEDLDSAGEPVDFIDPT